MKLYMSLNSPYARLVRVLVREAGCADKVTEVQVDPRDGSSGYWATNPIGLIPALELADGLVLSESDLVCRHIDDALAGGRFYAGVRRDARRAAALGMAQGILFRGLLARTDQMRPAAPDRDAFVARQLSAASRAADALEKTIEDHEGVDIVDIVFGATVGWFGFRHEAVGILQGRPKLTRWFERLDRRPAFSETRPG